MWCWRCWMPGTRRAVAARSWKRPCAELGAGSAWCWCSIRSVRSGGGKGGGAAGPPCGAEPFCHPLPPPPDLVPRDVVAAWLKFLRAEFPTVAFKASTQQQSRNLVGSRHRWGGAGGVTRCPLMSPCVTQRCPFLTWLSPAVTWCCPLVTHSPFVACSSVTWHLTATQCHPAVSRCHLLSPSSVLLSPVVTHLCPVVTQQCPVVTQQCPIVTQCHPSVSHCHLLSPICVPLSPSSVPLSPNVTHPLFPCCLVSVYHPVLSPGVTLSLRVLLLPDVHSSPAVPVSPNSAFLSPVATYYCHLVSCCSPIVIPSLPGVPF